MLQHRLPDDVVHAIIRGAVEAERKFICSSAKLQSKNGERWVKNDKRKCRHSCRGSLEHQRYAFEEF